MFFELTEEQVLVQETARRFAEEDIAPTLEEEEKNHEFRQDRVARMGELGFLSCVLPEELGGNGMGFFESVLMAEQIAEVSASWRLPFNMQNLGAPLSVARFGTDEQKEKYIPGWIEGTQMGFFAMTESNTGSDVSSMLTHAVDKGDHWELNGNKLWITNGGIASFFTVFALTRTGEGHGKMTAFIVTGDMEGVSFSAHEDKMGLRASSTTSILFDNVSVPAENVLGEVGKLAMTQK